MGNGLTAKRVFANVEGLNQMFAPDIFNDADGGTRVIIKFLRKHMYPKLFSVSEDPDKILRQGSLWFAASVLTPHIKLQKYSHPAKSHRRWIKWLIWLSKAHKADHDAIIAAINLAIRTQPTGRVKPSIEWRWYEDTNDANFKVVIDPPDSTGKQKILIISIKGDLSEVDKAARDGDDDNEDP